MTGACTGSAISCADSVGIGRPVRALAARQVRHASLNGRSREGRALAGRGVVISTEATVRA
jgi:hypothetical protein